MWFVYALINGVYWTQNTSFNIYLQNNTALYATEYGKGLKSVPVISYVWWLAGNSYLPGRKIWKPFKYQAQKYSHIVSSCNENGQ